MPNPRLATRYAKSLIGLSTERKSLEVVYNDMKFLQDVMKKSKEFVVVLKSPAINADKKQAIISAVAKNNIGELTTAFIKLLIQKGRESDLPEIINSFVDQYNEIKGIHKMKLITAVPVSDELKNAIIEKSKTEAGLDNIELETKVDNSLIGGFVLEYNNKLVDASVLRDLRDIKKQFQKNVYIHNIR